MGVDRTAGEAARDRVAGGVGDAGARTVEVQPLRAVAGDPVDRHRVGGAAAGYRDAGVRHIALSVVAVKSLASTPVTASVKVTVYCSLPALFGLVPSIAIDDTLGGVCSIV